MRIPGDIEPIGNRPPRPRIETAPQYTPAQELMPHHLQIQIDHVENIERKLRGERIWQIVRQTAEGCNAPTRSPVVSEGVSDGLAQGEKAKAATEPPIDVLEPFDAARNLAEALEQLRREVDAAMGLPVWPDQSGWDAA